MKKLLILFIIASCGSLLLSSCSRLENLSVTKRHYRSGFYIDLASRKPDRSTPQTVETEIAATASSPSSPSEDQYKISTQKEIQSTAPVVSTGLVQKKNRTNKQTKGILYASKQDASTIASDVQAGTLKNYLASLPDIISGSPGHSSESVPFWLIIVCCIFIPPLGVALKFGIDIHFWISLILTLLFFFPGMIYSLIVVLQ